MGCDLCHDPHDQTNPYGLRSWDLEMNYPCQTCHDLKWQNATYLAKGGEEEVGNGWDFGNDTKYKGEYDPITATGNPHLMTKKCVSCHMTRDVTNTDAYGVMVVGGHTMRMRDMGPDGEPYTGDDVLNIAVCQNCHPGLTTFDRNGVQTKIKQKIDQLGDLLKVNNHEYMPPFQPGKCAKCHKGSTLPFLNESFLLTFEHAYSNYKLALHDRSYGIHNPGYIEGILDDSMNAINTAFLCTPDIDCDQYVGFSDLVVMKIEFNSSGCDPEIEENCCQADVDNDGAVGFSDLVILKVQFGRHDCDSCTVPCTF